MAYKNSGAGFDLNTATGILFRKETMAAAATEEENVYAYEHATDFVKSFLPPGYSGNVYRLSSNWMPLIPVPAGPCKILEIGCYHGANVCSLMKTYATHEKSEIHCVDPWFDYEGYSEYKEKQPTNFTLFLRNVSKLDPQDIQKLYFYRALSEDAIPKFQDETFDIIFIDGNHETKYILEDAVLSFKKLKPGGWIVFDDMQCDIVQKSVKAFYSFYAPYFGQFFVHEGQCFAQKIHTSV